MHIPDWSEISKLAQDFFDLAHKKQYMLATAESCTGGLIAATLTDFAGSSNIFDRGFITYSNEAKHEILDVSYDLLEDYGAVSEEVAIAMVEGALNNSKANIAVSVTGIAGPTGGTEEKPVGLVFMGFGFKNANKIKSDAHKFLFAQDNNLSRDEIRRKAVFEAYRGLISY